MTQGALSAALAVALLIAGCATPRDRVILLPDAQGKVGKIAVLGKDGEIVLDQAYAAASTDTRGGVTTQKLDAETVRRSYAAELAGLPLRPVTYQLYFKGNTIQFTAESENNAPRFYAEIAQRPVAEVTLIGHSDTTGSATENQQLSLLRAMIVRAQLVGLGVSGFRIGVAGQGENKPVVPTADNVDEPRNRRVEIQVR